MFVLCRVTCAIGATATHEAKPTAYRASAMIARTMQHTLLLFDIDATLLKTHGAGMRCMAMIAVEMFGDTFRWGGIDPSGKLDPMIFAEALALNGIDASDEIQEQFRVQYLRRLQEELIACADQVQVMPGVHELLALLRDREAHRGDIMLGLLTGNFTAAVPIKLGAIDVDPDWFTITAFGDEADSRPDMLGLAMRRYEDHTGHPPCARRVIIIGDTNRDIDCAKAHGAVAFAVATGRYTVEDLRDHGADVATQDLSDPSPLLELIDNSITAAST